MSIATSEYRTSVDSLKEALRLLEKPLEIENPTHDTCRSIRSAVNMAMQGAKSLAILQGITDATVLERKTK